MYLQKIGIFLCSWKLTDHHWSRNHDPINIPLYRLMQVAQFFLPLQSQYTELFIYILHDRYLNHHCWMIFLLFNPKCNLTKLGLPLIVETQLLWKPWRHFSLLMTQTSLFVGRKVGKEADIIADILSKDSHELYKPESLPCPSFLYAVHILLRSGT